MGHPFWHPCGGACQLEKRNEVYDIGGSGSCLCRHAGDRCTERHLVAALLKVLGFFKSVESRARRAVSRPSCSTILLLLIHRSAHSDRLARLLPTSSRS